MSDQWYYRIYGQDFGPVSLELVRSLVESGTIAPDDEVRDATRSNWILACAASELRDSIKSPISELAVERRATRDEWFCRGAAGDFGPLKLADLIQLAAAGQLGSDEQIKAKADDYWKQISSIQRLVALLPFPDKHRQQEIVGTTPSSHQGLRLTTQISPDRHPSNPLSRHETDKDLSTIEDEEPVVVLFPSVQRQRTINEPITSSADDAIPIDVHGTSEQQQECQYWTADVISQSTESIAAAMIEDAIANDRPASIRMPFHLDAKQHAGDSQWTGWIGGKEFGPVDYSQLLTWAVTGELSPTDFVRQGSEGDLVPAVSIPCLFTVRAATVPLPLSRSHYEISSSRIAPATRFEGIDPYANDKKLQLLKALQTAGRVTQSDRTSVLRKMATDPTSIGVSAILTIALIVVGWIAFQ